jgi:negative regulator of flagellin synthesis FlgM
VSTKINGFENRPVQVGGDRPLDRGGAARQPDKPAETSSNVQLTDSALRLAALERALADVPEIDMQRVAELRDAIESGSYAVDARKLADKLLELEQALHAAQRGD